MIFVTFLVHYDFQRVLYRHLVEINFFSQAGSFQEKPKLMRLVCDVSGSMFRFNGHDGRMDRQVETLLMVMEAFEGYEQKIMYEVFGHSGEGPSFPFVKVKGEGSDGRSKAPKNDKQRLDVFF